MPLRSQWLGVEKCEVRDFFVRVVADAFEKSLSPFSFRLRMVDTPAGLL
jgi:hypothetical protein